MNTSITTFEDAKKLYPDEWVLFGNPELNNTSVVNGVILFHSKDKKEVCYIGKKMTIGYKSVTIVYAGNLKHSRHIGILKRI